jgi:hypothetical protein
MANTIIIQGKTIEFPSSAQSPNWSEGIIDFANAVSDALSGVVGTYDVPPQTYAIVSDVNSNVNVPALTFPTATVRGAFVRYAFYRTSDTATEAETGTLTLLYNSAAGTWQISRDAVGTVTKLSFTVTNIGQVQLSTTAIGGTYQSGKLTYSAQAILQN